MQQYFVKKNFCKIKYIRLSLFLEASLMTEHRTKAIEELF